MRDRLVELLQNFADGTYTSNVRFVDNTKVDDVADYLLANGVIVPPVKVGDTVYRINKMPSINYAQLDKDWDWAISKQSVLAIEHVIEVSKWWNKYYFATKEGAEEKVKELKNAETQKS